MQQACVPELEHMKTWHPDPDIRGLGGSLKNFFRPFRPQFGLKISGGGGHCLRTFSCGHKTKPETKHIQFSWG